MMALTLRLVYTCVKTLNTEFFYINDKISEELEVKKEVDFLYTKQELRELENIKDLCCKCSEFLNMILTILPFIEEYYKKENEKEK